MKNSTLIIALFMSMFFAAHGQGTTADQLFLTNGETLKVTVKKVDPQTITYSFQGEALENVIEKTEVAKIIFKSGREQLFSSRGSASNGTVAAGYEYPKMQRNTGGVLPFDFIFDGAPSPEEGTEAQLFYYDNLMRRPERNTISYQDPDITKKRLRAAGIREASQYQDYEMSEIAKILGVGVVVTGRIVVKYRSTTSSTSGSTTVKVNEKKKKANAYSSDYTTSQDEFDTKVTFRIYDVNGNKIMDETRRPFMATTRDNYISALNYLMKRTPYYQKK